MKTAEDLVAAAAGGWIKIHVLMRQQQQEAFTKSIRFGFFKKNICC